MTARTRKNGFKKNLPALPPREFVSYICFIFDSNYIANCSIDVTLIVINFSLKVLTRSEEGDSRPCKQDKN